MNRGARKPVWHSLNTAVELSVPKVQTCGTVESVQRSPALAWRSTWSRQRTLLEHAIGNPIVRIAVTRQSFADVLALSLVCVIR